MIFLVAFFFFFGCTMWHVKLQSLNQELNASCSGVGGVGNGNSLQ